MASNEPSASNRHRSLAPPGTPGAVATPNRRAISAEPASGRQSASARRPGATPHARAISRAIDQRRRTIFTPGRARRRSLRDQRETPRDILRNLSRVLAPASQQLRSSSSRSSSPGADASNATLTPVPEDDDDFPIERPRFSLPLQEDDDDDDSDLKAPRLSGLEDENYTAMSIELPRRERAWSDGPSRLGRESLGSVRFSDDIGIDSGFFPPPALDDDSGNVMLDEGDVLERFDAEDLRRQTLGRESLFGPIEIPEGVDETTFVMAPVDSPVRDPTVTEEIPASEAPDMIDDDDDDHVNEPMDWPESDIDEDVPDGNADIEAQDENIVSKTAELSSKRGRRTKAGKKISKHGIEYPSLPQGVVKRLATTFAKTSGIGKAKISADTMNAITQATDWFFEQLGDDLSAYAKHAGRKTIDESDMITLMRRQRQIGASVTPFSLAQRYLPRELLQELRMPVPPPTKAPRKKSSNIDAEEDEDVT
ncbi:centromere kinetochore component CENP-T-domain-containing protein [Truncatella angustata]|uniref:Centromere kinetochore component CENP-T-domain-containing protein n=1 Tax=Truncatella angustata TaxID=152316 RepID=A0A9P8UEX5_9PEZI|nr:centromere kinetochore component CENP-T-domain-containing protein [Truncatella angustata]KAH6648706.1 centromere kinetochore component CENP-T-domain-containing protein [Truncatella angustata]